MNLDANLQSMGQEILRPVFAQREPDNVDK